MIIHQCFVPGASIPQGVYDLFQGDWFNAAANLAAILPGVNPKLVHKAANYFNKAANKITKKDMNHWFDIQNLQTKFGRHTEGLPEWAKTKFDDAGNAIKDLEMILILK